jgi:hypothetical protein
MAAQIHGLKPPLAANVQPLVITLTYRPAFGAGSAAEIDRRPATQTAPAGNEGAVQPQ